MSLIPKKSAPTVEQRLQRTLIHLQIHKPFYGVLSSNLNWRIDKSDTVKTACTDGVSVIFGEEFTSKCSNEELLTVAVHELNHVAKKHILRRQRRSNSRWNIAADHQINLELKKDGCIFGDYLTSLGLYMDPKFANTLEEDIYEQIPEPDKDKAMNNVGGFSSNIGELTEGFSRDPGSYADYEGKLDRTLERAVMVAKSCGKCPGWAENYIFENRRSKVNWRSKLRRFIMQSLSRGGDLTWSRPIKRLMWQGTFLPSDAFVYNCDVVCAFDTSGSMGKPEIDACVSELNAIYQEFYGHASIYNIWFNTQVYHFEKTSAFEAPTKIESGGTDFQCVFDHIKENKMRPKCLIMLTDMECPFPQKPTYPVLWCSTTGVEGPYGDTIKIEV